MSKSYKGRLSLEWYNSQKAIMLAGSSDSIHDTDVPAPRVSWVNRDEALFYEIDEEQAKGVTPFWVDRNDIRIREARPLVFQSAFDAVTADKPGTIPGTDEIFEVKETNRDRKDIPNVLIQGDNLLSLNTLKKMFANLPEDEKIKCIYIDPPYNTGSGFENYDDNLEHSEWLTLMRDRLEVLAGLLSEFGSIWVQLDDNEAHYCKLVLDEIMGRNNFVASIVWQKVFAKKNKALISDSHDYILVYARDITKWKRNLETRTAMQTKAFKNPDNDPRGDWQSVAYSVQSEDAERRAAYRYPIKLPAGGEALPPAGRHWNGLQDRTEALVRDNRLWFGPQGNKPPRIKVFLSEVQEGVVPDTWWDHNSSGNNQEAKKEQLALYPGTEPFNTPKPERLIRRILEIASDPGDLVLDSFAGSGTTGAVAHKMRRRWIMVELGEHCHTHIIPRMKSVISGTDDGGVTEDVGWTGGGAFRYYRLGPSIIQMKQDGTSDFNWKLGKEFIEESFLSSYDYSIVADIDFAEGELFKDKGSRPKVGIQHFGTKSRIAVVSLDPPNGRLPKLSYDEVMTIYRKAKEAYAPEYVNIFTNRSVELAFDSKPDDLEIIKVPSAIFAELEK